MVAQVRVKAGRCRYFQTLLVPVCHLVYGRGGGDLFYPTVIGIRHERRRTRARIRRQACGASGVALSDAEGARTDCSCVRKSSSASKKSEATVQDLPMKTWAGHVVDGHDVRLHLHLEFLRHQLRVDRAPATRCCRGSVRSTHAPAKDTSSAAQRARAAGAWRAGEVCVDGAGARWGS